MTMESDPVAQAINDARALIDTLLASDWQEMHVVSGDTEIFLARVAGVANPMRAAPSVAAAVSAPAPAQPGPTKALLAPHVATLLDALPVGTTVSAGQTVATIRVLDEREELAAPASGTIVAVDAQAGALLEYGVTLLTIEAAA